MASINKKRLGESLESLISIYNHNTSELSLDQIVVNEEQPRKFFNEEKINSLKKSIKENGILQPILVRKFENKYQIIAGERRFRAAKSLGLEKIPVIVKESNEINSLELAIIENIERENLNPIEEIEAFEVLIDKYNYTHKQLAEKFNQDRSTIANKIRILNLPKNIKIAIQKGLITLGHGRALLSANDRIEELFKLTLEKNLNVRELEKLTKSEPNINKKNKSGKNNDFRPHEEKLKKFFDSEVKISFRKDKGKIEISFRNLEEMKNIIKRIEN